MSKNTDPPLKNIHYQRKGSGNMRSMLSSNKIVKKLASLLKILPHIRGTSYFTVWNKYSATAQTQEKIPCFAGNTGDIQFVGRYK